MTEAKAIRNSVEGRDSEYSACGCFYKHLGDCPTRRDVPRGPSATQLHDRAISAAVDRALAARERRDLRSAKAYLDARGWEPEPEGESVFEDGAA